jgi:hypothetical protein
MVVLCQWLCHLCGELWYHTHADGFTYVSSMTVFLLLLPMEPRLAPLTPHFDGVSR